VHRRDCLKGRCSSDLLAEFRWLSFRAAYSSTSLEPDGSIAFAFDQSLTDTMSHHIGIEDVDRVVQNDDDAFRRG
jgi:hypothetical protein